MARRCSQASQQPGGFPSCTLHPDTQAMARGLPACPPAMAVRNPPHLMCPPPAGDPEPPQEAPAHGLGWGMSPGSRPPLRGGPPTPGCPLAPDDRRVNDLQNCYRFLHVVLSWPRTLHITTWDHSRPLRRDGSCPADSPGPPWPPSEAQGSAFAWSLRDVSQAPLGVEDRAGWHRQGQIPQTPLSGSPVPSRMAGPRAMKPSEVASVRFPDTPTSGGKAPPQ